jgi:hypothetical protein
MLEAAVAIDTAEAEDAQSSQAEQTVVIGSD